MASIDLEYNSGFQIYNSDGTPFHDLVLHKCTYETVVMSLGDKISGILYYKDNALDVTMSEYIIYKGVRYTLVNPPTILREGLVSDNSELRGMTKYSFTFYHPMYVLNNFPFSDIAVQSGESRYLSQNKTFSWIGTLVDFVAKLNKNLEDTQWMVTIGNVTQEEQTKLSEVLSFDKNTIAEALKRGYETWEVPYVVDQIPISSPDYPEKQFVVQFGLPTTEILDEYNEPFVFQMGQGVGLKNNSRNPKNNKIITRIAGYGSEDNIPYGYPQIPYYGGNVQYPLYYGIVGGQRVQLIKHPFTRNHLMPSVYSQSVYNKVNPKLSNGSNNPNYDPTIELVDYYDADDNTYQNQIKQDEPSYEIHEFGDIKPELGEKTIISAVPVSQQETQSDYKQKSDFLQEILDRISATEIEDEKTELLDVYDRVDSGLSYYKRHGEEGGDTYWYVFSITTDNYYEYVSYESSNYNFTATVLINGSSAPTPDWDDTMDDDGNYLQSYFKITLPTLEFDLYACAAITQEMKINMRSGACIGCTFPVEVDWDDYKRNFYNSDGEFDPDGEQRDYTKYPDSSDGQITVMVKKELETFGTLMPNQYQQPTTGDKFVILGISLPETYITSAEQRLDTDMKQYMLDNNVYYFDYPLKFDEHFLINHEDILSQMKNNVVVRFNYAGTEHALYIKQMSVKYNESPLPKYDITLTDDIEIVLNQIGQVTDEVSKLRLGFGAGGFGTVGAEYIRKDIDDTARGTIRMIKGMQVGERFVTGLLGEGGVFRKDSDGTTYLETDKLYVRMKAYFDTVEVKHYLHTGGNRIASQASGIVCSRVEMIDAYNNLAMDVADAVLFRCFFKANDGDKTIRNDFMIGDLAFCHETNVDVSSVNLHGYWRLVIGRNADGLLTENKEAWIDLSNRASETLTIDGEQYVCNGYQNGSDAPIAQDDIIQLGNIANKDRQGAIVEYVGGEDAPSYQIFQGIGEDLPYPYTLEDKNYIGLGYSSQTGHAYMNVYGDMFIGAKPDPVTGESPTYIKYEQEDSETGLPKMTIKAVVEFQSPDDPTQTTTLDDFANAVVGEINNIQSQIDGTIDTWFYDYMPVDLEAQDPTEPLLWVDENHTIPCLPYKDWYDADTAAGNNNERIKHLGDIFYDNTSGYAFRFSNTGTEANPNFAWVEITDSAVIKALENAAKAQDTADHKRRVFTAQPYPPYDAGDLWVNATYPANNTETDDANHRYYNDLLKCVAPVPRTESGQEITTFSINDWTLASKYTDDTGLNNFVSNTYAPFVTNIQGQVDKKAETWYQDSDPSVAWTTDDLKANHVGDIWCDTSQNGGKKTYIWKDFGTSANPRYAWAEQAVPDAVFDKIDGKADIFVSKPTTYNVNDMWIIEDGLSSTDMPTGCQSGDIVISSASRVNNYQKTDWSKKDRYTDDTKYNNFISALLNGMPAGSGEAAVEAALNAIKAALNQGTTINGGLVLSTLIGLRDSNNVLWSGINGQYDANALGGGIAAWYGGSMIDHEVSPSLSGYAKSLFRFDGSGYLAGGNITWDSNGIVTIANVYANIDGTDTSLTGTLQTLTNLSNALPLTLRSGVTYLDPQYGFTQLSISHANDYTITDNSVLNFGEMKSHFVTIDFFNALFTVYSDANRTTVVNPATWTAQTVINNLKILVGTWTTKYLSALGYNPQQSGGGGVGDVTWDLLASSSDTHQIASSHLTTALSGYATKSWVSSNFNKYEHPTGGANTTITAADGKVLSSITVNNLGHVTAVGSKTLAATDIPSLSWNKITTDKPTTISGYGITDAFTKTEVNGFKWWGVSLSNGVVTGNMTNVGSISMSSTISGCTSIDSLLYFDTTNSYIGLNTSSPAYELDVIGQLRFRQTSSQTASCVLGCFEDSRLPFVRFRDHDNNAFDIRLVNVGTNESPNYGLEMGRYNKFTDIIGANIRMYSKTSADTDSILLALRTIMGGRVAVGAADSTLTGGNTDCKLVVNGNACTAESNGTFMQIGLIRLVYDSTNNALKVIKKDGTTANFYATGAVSAFGSNTASGGGGINLSDVFEAYRTSNSSNEQKIDNSHLKFNISNYATTYDLNNAIQSCVAPADIGTLTINSETWNPYSDGTKTISLGIGNLTNVNISSPTDGQVLKYDASTSKWVNGAGGGSTYTLPAATSGALGGIKIGFTNDATNRNYGVTLSSETTTKDKAYVNVPWTDTKNTVGINTIGDSPSTVYLVGTKTAPNPITGSDYATSFESSTCYIKSNYLYSNGSQVLTKSSGLGDLSNVTLSNLADGQVLKYNGTNWINSSDSDEKVKVENGEPTSSTQYFLTFYTSVPSSGETGSLKVNTGLKYFTIKNSSNGAAILELGNYVSSSSLAAQRKIGQLRLLHRSHGFWGTLEIADSLTANQTYTLPSVGGTIATTGNVVTLTGNQDISGTKTFNDKISLGGTTNQTCKLYVNGNTLANGNLTVGQTTMNTGSKLYVSGKATITGDFYAATDFMIRKVTNPDNSYYYTIGINQKTVSAQGTWQGTFTSGSDIRQKDVIQNREISLEDIARTPIFEFTWKDKRDTKVHLGTSAQYWDSLLPSVVYGQQENSLSMDYGATALASAVITARKVVDHEQRIRLLEVENQALRKEIEQLKKAV